VDTKKRRKKSVDEVEDSILSMVRKNETELKEDPEFRFRRKPTVKPKLVGNVVSFHCGRHLCWQCAATSLRFL
jgi:ribosomal protein S19